MANDKLEFSTKINAEELIKELKHAQELLLKFGDSSKEAEQEINNSLNKVIENLGAVGEEAKKVEEETNKLNQNLKNIGNQTNLKNTSLSFDNLKTKIIDVSKGVGDLSKKVFDLGKQTVDKLKNSFIALGGAIGGIVASSVNVGAEFEGIMTDVGVLSGLALDGSQEALNQMQMLEDKAKEIGRTTQFSAVQAGEGFKTMAMAGYSAQDMLNALPSAMSLAGATGEDLNLVIDRMVNNLNAFGMSTEDAGRFADVVATATTKVTTNVAELTEAFLEAGTISNAFGINVEDTSIVLGVLADNGIKASKAGTAYKNVLLGLNAPTKEAQKLMSQYNLQVLKNADGSMNLIGTLQDMSEKLKDVDDATKANVLTTIVGREAYASLNILLNTSKERFDELGDAIYNSSGRASEMSELMLNNLKGQITILKSSFEGLQLAIFDNIAPITKEGVKFINDSLNEVTQAIENGEINRIPEILGRVLSQAFLNIGQAIPSFIQTISNSLNSFFTTLLQNTSQLSLIGLNIVTSLLNGIRQQLPNLFGLISSLAPAIATFFVQGIPLIFEVGITVITALVDGLGSNPQLIIDTITTIITNLIDTITNNLPIFLEQGLNIIFALIEGIAQNLPQIIDALILVLDELINTIINNLPEFVQKGMELIISIIQGIGQKAGVLLAKIVELIGSILKTWWDNIPQIIKAGGEFIVGLIKGIVSEIPNILSKVTELAQSLITAIGDGFKAILDVGKNLVLGLWEGIKNAWSSLVGWVGDLASGLIGSVKKVFGIHSPSRVFAEIGVYLDEGLAEGIKDGQKEVTDTAKQMAKDVINSTNEEFNNVDSINLTAEVTTEGTKDFLQVKQNILNEVIALEQEYLNRTKEIKEEEKRLIQETNKEYINQIELIKNLYSDPIQTSLPVNEDLQALSDKGVNQSLINELESLGIKAHDQIQVLLSMTDEELKEYELLWLSKYKNINDSVLIELDLLKQQNKEKLQEIQQESQLKMEEQKESYKNKLTSLVEESLNILNNLPLEALQIGALTVANIEQGVKDATPSLRSTLMNTINSLIAEARASLTSQLSSLTQEAQNTISTFTSYGNSNAYAYNGSFGANGTTSRNIENTTNYVNNKNNTITQNITFMDRAKTPYETAKEIKRKTKDLL